MNDLTRIFKNDMALYLYLFLSISIGWYYGQVGKNYANKYDIAIVMFIETIVIFIGITLLLTHTHLKNPQVIVDKLSKVSGADYMALIAFAIYGFCLTFFGLKFLAHHDVSKVRISEFIISIPISAFGLYFFSTQKITREKIGGLLLVVLGGYFFMK